MSNFRRLRRWNKGVDQSWLMDALKGGVDLNPKPFVGKRNKAKEVKMKERRHNQMLRALATAIDNDMKLKQYGKV